MRSLGWSWSHRTGVLMRRGGRDTDAHRDKHVRTWGGDAVHTHRRDQPCPPLGLRLQPPGWGEGHHVLFKPPRVWWSSDSPGLPLFLPWTWLPCIWVLTTSALCVWRQSPCRSERASCRPHSTCSWSSGASASLCNLDSGSGPWTGWVSPAAQLV